MTRTGGLEGHLRSKARSTEIMKMMSATSFPIMVMRLKQRSALFSTEAAKTVAAAGDRVYVNLTAKDPETGQVLFSSEGEPISFVVGQGMVIVGLEKRIIGCKVGEGFTETFEPAEAFGFVDPDKFRKITKPTDENVLKQITVGSSVQLDSGEYAKVVKIEDEYIIVDLNSTLVGKRITFEVKLERIEDEINNVMSGVQVQTVKPGDGKTFPKVGSRVSVHYIGTLADGGREFDSSRRNNRAPFSFVLGAGLVIKGWDVGIGKLSLGERAMLFIPSEMGYSTRGAGDAIPPNANLVFDVELLEIDGVRAS
jgi:FK506-binding protein 1